VTRVLLVRHGHVEGIYPERFRGRAEVPLSELGRRQAEATAAMLARRWRVGAVVTSPMGRCVETGAVIAQRFGKRSEVIERLNDLDYGEWQWLTHEEASVRSPPLYKRWLNSPDLVRFPGGESLYDVAARVAEALRFIVSVHGRKTVVVVSHDSVNRVILSQKLAQPLGAYWRLVQSPCGVSEIDIDGDRIRVLRINETAHVEGLQP